MVKCQNIKMGEHTKQHKIQYLYLPAAVCDEITLTITCLLSNPTAFIMAVHAFAYVF